MTIRFRKSIRIAPGVRINLSKSGVSTSFGSAPFSVNVKGSKALATTSIPGTGLSASQANSSDEIRPGARGGNRGVLVLCFIVVGIVWAALGFPAKYGPSSSSLRATAPQKAIADRPLPPPSQTMPVAAYSPPAPPRQSEPVPEPAKAWTAYTTSAVKLRARPDGNASVLSTVPLGSAVRAMETNSGWRHVVVAGTEGWVADRYLSNSAPAPKPTPTAPPQQPASPLFVARAAPAVAGVGGPFREPYIGRCECPYDLMRNGRRCGGNSAYSRPGGARPSCYR